MKKVALLVAAVFAAAAWVGSAVAAKPAPGPTPSFQDAYGQPTVQRVNPLLVPKGGIGTWPGDTATTTGPIVGGVSTTTSAYYPTCFSASGAWSGPDDWSGYAHLNGWLYWCSNGFWITYASGGEYPTTAGYYSLNYHAGAWWSSGCVGCQTISMQDYMIWSWTAPLIGYTRTGTTWLTQTGSAFGGYWN